ncbi:CoA transferase subunit A [Verminephrobacter aporrectodeae]|uniref:CoA transferase subunit A n=1 Tax=Verminephrobacter aporrectodeae TaxID=1110389 RepID=UPI0022431725|nr:3-oxoacid CoA-transferase subunit A [Verminephrobacter aporrectodeae]MCW8176845.1 CoA transferase subunit A [Verminephrobacter aporrectodeae subsp. tuberculatae]MCW8204114.1 CoA transferase subunit A [Verminephrobacter aporrectodeae subsp. tuberculatae]
MSKRRQLAEVIEAIPDGASIMVGGFGSPGTPFSLLAELQRQRKRRLTIIKNDANQDGYGVSRLIEAGVVSRLLTTHLGLSAPARRAHLAGALQVEFFSQGLFAERIRCAGVGLPGVVTDIELPDELGVARESIEVAGRQLFFEPAIRADYALLHADRADGFGNLRYRGAARNFSPLMAMAADQVFVETRTISDAPLAPDSIHTPGIYVQGLVQVAGDSYEYQPIPR